MKYIQIPYRKTINACIVCLAFSSLAACSSGGGDNSATQEPATLTTTVDPAMNTDDNTVVVTGNNSGGSFVSQLLGSWVLCSDDGGLRFEWEFTETTYSNSLGVGSCAGFEEDTTPLVNSGPYSITGTTISDSGLTVQEMELTTTAINGSSVFESLRETRFRLAFIDDNGQLFFSIDSFEGTPRETALNFDAPYMRIP